MYPSTSLQGWIRSYLCIHVVSFLILCVYFSHGTLLTRRYFVQKAFCANNALPCEHLSVRCLVPPVRATMMFVYLSALLFYINNVECFIYHQITHASSSILLLFRHLLFLRRTYCANRPTKMK